MFVFIIRRIFRRDAEGRGACLLPASVVIRMSKPPRALDRAGDKVLTEISGLLDRRDGETNASLGLDQQ
jgi:hypothetical protein